MYLDIVFEPFSVLAPLFIRLALAWVFIAHGYAKLFTTKPGVLGFSGVLRDHNVPFPFLFALLIGVEEFFGGVALFIGIATRWTALILTVSLILAILKLTYKKGFTRTDGAGYEFDVVLLAGTLTLLVMGPGSISVDWILGVR
jgi:putative oxidoreductase